MNTNGTPKPTPTVDHRPGSAPPRSLDELVKQRDAEPGTGKPAQPEDAGRSGGGGKNAGSAPGSGAPGGGGNGGGPNGGGKGASGSANGGGKGGGRSGGGAPQARKRAGGVRRWPWHPSTILAGLASSALTLGTGGLALVAIVMNYFVADLPDVDKLRIPNRPPSITVMSDDGEIMGRRGTVHAGLVTFEELPDQLVQAVIAIEDQRFFDHIGIDFQGTARAAWANYQAGHVVQGGSTLTQQLAKNLFLRPDRTIRRKIQEMILALRLEGAFTKREILEMYLNRVYFGAGVYGIEAAAERYFEKSARDLTLSESAMLAGLLKAPSLYSPTSNKDRAINRAQVVLRNMTEAGFINEEDRFVAEQVLRMPRARSENHELAPFVLDWVAESLPDFVGEPKGDLVIETTLDLSLQEIAEEAAGRIIAEEGEAKHVEQASVVLMSNDGAVRALVGGLDYADSQFNRAVKALRQPGSTFKVFVYSAALEYGYSPWDQRYDQPIRIGDWEPKNYGNTYRGPVTIHEALTRSINTVSAQVTAEIGPEAVVGMAHRLGISSNLEAVPSIALGTGEVTLYELTGAFTAFANGGEVAVPHVIKRVLAADGRVLFERAGSSGGLVLSPIEVSDMNMMLESVVNAGTGRRAHLDDRPAAGKTGTTQDYRDAWFIGYTGQYTAGVWVGNDDNSEMKRVTGGSIPATIWKEVMVKVHEGLPVLELQSTSDLPPLASQPQPYASRSPLGSFLNNLFGVRQPQPPTYARRYGGYGEGYPDRYGNDPYDGNRYGARDPYGRRPLTYPGIAARGADGLPAYEVLPLDRRGVPLPPGQAYGAPGGQPWAGQVQTPRPGLQPQRRQDQPKTRTRIFFGNRQVN